MKLLHKVLYGHLRCLEIWEHFINKLLFALRHRISSLSTLLDCLCYYIIIHTYLHLWMKSKCHSQQASTITILGHWDWDFTSIIKFSLNFLSNVCTLTALRNLFKLSHHFVDTGRNLLTETAQSIFLCVCLLCVHKITLSLNIEHQSTFYPILSWAVC